MSHHQRPVKSPMNASTRRTYDRVKLGLAAIGFVFGAPALITGCAPSRSEDVAGAESAVGGVAVGEVRGVVEISSTLRTRVFDDEDPATATFDVSRVAGPVFRLRRQLGVFAQDGTSSSYQGGPPTPLRMTLWHQVFGRLATALGESCATLPPAGDAATAPTTTFAVYAKGNGSTVAPATFRLQPIFAERLRAACTFEGDEASHRTTAANLWDAVMGLGGTLADDKEAFVVRFAGGATTTPRKRVENMMLAMLLNPHFLLAK